MRIFSVEEGYTNSQSVRLNLKKPCGPEFELELTVGINEVFHLKHFSLALSTKNLVKNNPSSSNEPSGTQTMVSEYKQIFHFEEQVLFEEMTDSGSVAPNVPDEPQIFVIPQGKEATKNY